MQKKIRKTIINENKILYLDIKLFIRDFGSWYNERFSVLCDRYFTLKKKIKAFIRNSLFVLEVEKDKIEDFVNKILEIDLENLSRNIDDKLLELMNNKIDKKMEESV